jgi:hypothetical protein
MAFGHLSARELADLWPNGRTHPHLAGCGQCRSEYDALAEVVLAARDAAAEADGHFPAERLAAQQAQILRRLENAERPARVLPFPPSTRPFPGVRTGARRWIAAAAAAGLLTGIVAGRTFDFGSSWSSATLTQPEAEKIAHQRSQKPVLTSGTSATLNDERLLGEIEAALVEPRVDELRALDALTPRIREASLGR